MRRPIAIPQNLRGRYSHEYRRSPLERSTTDLNPDRHLDRQTTRTRSDDAECLTFDPLSIETVYELAQPGQSDEVTAMLGCRNPQAWASRAQIEAWNWRRKGRCLMLRGWAEMWEKRTRYCRESARWRRQDRYSRSWSVPNAPSPSPYSNACLSIHRPHFVFELHFTVSRSASYQPMTSRALSSTPPHFTAVLSS